MKQVLAMLFALLAWTLSTLPSCLADTCICEECMCTSACDAGDDCGKQPLPCDVCSPFVHCNTCAGCIDPAMLRPEMGTASVMVCEYRFFNDERLVSAYEPPLCQPPRRC